MFSASAGCFTLLQDIINSPVPVGSVGIASASYSHGRTFDPRSKGLERCGNSIPLPILNHRPHFWKVTSDQRGILSIAYTSIMISGRFVVSVLQFDSGIDIRLYETVHSGCVKKRIWYVFWNSTGTATQLASKQKRTRNSARGLHCKHHALRCNLSIVALLRCPSIVCIMTRLRQKEPSICKRHLSVR